MSENDVICGLAMTFAETEDLWRWHRRAARSRRRRVIVEWGEVSFAVTLGQINSAMIGRAQRLSGAATRSAASQEATQIRLC